MERYIIVPEYPYNMYTNGIVAMHSKMQRRMVYLYNNKRSNITATTISYARYLYAVHLWKTKKYLIPDDLVVDHINDDKTDDRIENFQLLTVAENTFKQNALHGRKIPILICPICMKIFTTTLSSSNFLPSRQNTIVCCSIEHTHTLRSWNIPTECRSLYAKSQRIAVLREYQDGRVLVAEIHNHHIWSKIWTSIFE